MHRERSGWTQAELAPRAQVDAKTVSRWELARHQPGIYQLRMLCIAFDASADEALGLPTRHAH